MKSNKLFMIGAGALLVAAILGVPEARVAPGSVAPTLGTGSGRTTTKQREGEIVAYATNKVIPAVFRRDVRDLPQVALKERPERPELTPPFNAKQLLPEAHAPQKEEPNIPLAPAPAPIQNFAGLSKTDPVTGGTAGAGWPPDTNGDVGPDHYILAVNDAFAIYNKTGTLLAAFTENSLWAGSGAPQCDGNAFGDPVVVYDALADRWILTNFAFSLDVSGNPVSPFYQCVAVSRTSDPVAGGYFLYAIRTDTGSAGQPPAGTINDYPKFGIWTDCLYYAANGFQEPAGSFNGVEFASFSRSDMYAGFPLTGALGFIATTTDPFTMIPSNLAAPAGATPPAGTPNYFVSESQIAFAFEVRTFTAGTNCDGGGTLSAATNVAQTSYTVPSSNIVPQPNTTNMLDSLGDRLMQKVQYRKVGSAESLWVTHTFQSSSTGPTGSQWAQINVTGGTIAMTPVQQQNYDPADGIYRWMSSIAADKDGNVALGYSTSNGTSPNFPSIAYSGRLAGDTLNMLPQTETQLIAGNGSQTNNCGGGPCHRWGDYSGMSVDPDGCTFWYTTGYYDSQTSGTAGNWHTRIGSFKFPQCVPPTLQLQSVVSRMTHGSITTPPFFDITFPLTGTRGVECRSSASLGSGNYTLVFTFVNNLTSVTSATVTGHDPTTGTGNVVGNIGAIGPNPNQYTVNLTNVSTGQYLTVTLNSVLDATGITGNVVSPQLGVLIGDVNADGGASNLDVSLVKAKVAAGATVDSSNFRDDVNADGGFSNLDVSITKAQVAAGQTLPSTP